MTHQNIGNVFLVGAGPGDPDLITVKGYRLIQTADVILYDRLVAPELLEDLPATTELIYVGKDPNAHHHISQEDINHLIVYHALQGKQVVRLKGGDPFIYGRGSEEALACYDEGIPFEVVPAVSSINGATAYAGIPLTHRHISASFTVITGHEAPDKPETQIHFRAIAQQKGTIIIMMGVRRLQDIIDQLIDCGLSAHTPCACIERGTTRTQHVIVSDVAHIAGKVTLACVSPPALIVIGEVVKLRDAGVNWFQGEFVAYEA